MRLTFVWALVTAAVALRAAGLYAQGSQTHDEAGLVTAAVTAIMTSLRTAERLPEGMIGFEPRRVADASSTERPRWGERRTDADVSRLLAALGATVVDFDSAAVCAGELPSSCRMAQGVAAFAAGAPEGGPDSASLVVRARWQSESAKQPVYEGTFEVTLRCDGGRWKVRRVRTLGIT